MPEALVRRAQSGPGGGGCSGVRVLGETVAVRVLLVLTALALLCGCGQASSPVERQEKQGGLEEATPEPTPEPAPEPTQPVVGNMPIAGVVGEDVEGGSYDFRVLDYYVTDHYYYRPDPTFESLQEDYFSQAGKLVVINYSVTNTSPQTISPNPIGQLHVRAGDKTEVYEETEEVTPPHHSVTGLPIDDLPPRQMVVSQFIFDVPTDVEPELVAVSDQPTIATVLDVGVVDLRGEEPQGPRPEEILALQYEYTNMTAWERAYDLFAQESKDRVPRETYVSVIQRDNRREPLSITDYSFPSVVVEGNHATVERVYSWATTDEEGQEKRTQEMVLEDEGWRIVMREEQYKYYLGGEETTQ
jgi:hypothetical protein